jgi:hypothetical protein
MLSVPSDLTGTITTSSTEADDKIASFSLLDDDVSEITREGDFYKSQQRHQHHHHHQQQLPTKSLGKGVPSWTSKFHPPISRDIIPNAALPSWITVGTCDV